ncbi:MAG TPA: lysylphosphatidylglycerol synthase transmembrane domain-containing protein [Acidimicrobiales bacterium]|nr:lysylphosphatidylglycerol synthase transmembrane domain-containing protein [Acidimicrobiales bacterium]
MLALRISVSAAMLAFLLSRFEPAALLPDGDPSTVPWLLLGLLVWFGAIVLGTVRWQRVLLALDLPSPFSPLLSHSLAGLFVANFLPSTVGGDFLRVMRLSSDNGEAPGSFASVALERLTGFVVLPVITLVGLALSPSLLHMGNATRLALALSLATLVALGAILAVAGSPRLGGRLAGHPSWLRFVGAVHLGIDRFRRHPGAAASVLAVAFAYQLTVVTAAWVGAQVLDLHLSWMTMLALIPVVAIAQVLPISVGGLGLREGALVLLLQPLGVAAAKATALGLLLYGLNLAVSLLGAPAFAVRRQAVSPLTARP